MQTPLKLIVILLFSAFLHQQSLAQIMVRSVKARSVGIAPVIDGRLSDTVWEHAERSSGFVQIAPEPGKVSLVSTEVSVLYDDAAVYVSATLYDKPDSIMRQLTARDDYENSNTDAFGVTFDTYYDKQNATQFVVTAAGVQTDGIVKFDNIDVSWNAAWYSRVSSDSRGWYVEMKIPYSALRFPQKPVQEWGINFFRVVRRNREKSYWSKVDPTIQNSISQEGVVTGIADIKSPVRLALLPYISAYGENYDGANAGNFNGGLDVKYGFNESFTLDMTLVPDFGQTVFDNKVLNLSPVEVKYDERRYFFTEGVSLFNKNDLFYSRRVGGTPVNYYKEANSLDSNEVIFPSSTKLYNATKISGRTKRSLGIGFFNAVSAPTFSVVKNTVTNEERKVQTAPLTNYNVVVLDQAMKNNSYVSLVNTNVSRKENSYNANVSALMFKFADRKNRYNVQGSGDVSQLFYKTQKDVGYRYIGQVGKQSGNYTFILKNTTISDRFNPNDLGYLDRNNISTTTFDNDYKTYKPRGIVNNSYNSVGVTYYRVFNPDVFSHTNVYGSHNVTFTSFHTIGFYWEAQPAKGYDYYEPRTLGRFYIYPENFMTGGFLSSDYRRKFALDIEVNNRNFSENKRNSLYWLFSPRLRFSDKFSTVYRLEQLYAADDVGFVDRQGDSIFLGTRNVNTITNTLTADYIFTSTMSLKLNARHYWSQAEYSAYSLLNQDGTLDQSNYSKSRNINYNSFNVFLNFVWQYRPGSEMSVVYQNSVYSSGGEIVSDYLNNLNTTLQAPQSNSLSVKMIYYLDYQTLKKLRS